MTAGRVICRVLLWYAAPPVLLLKFLTSGSKISNLYKQGMRPGRRDHPSLAARGTAALQPTYNAQTRPLPTLKRGRNDPEFQEDDDLDDVAADAYRRRLVSASGGPLAPNSIIPQVLPSPLPLCCSFSHWIPGANSVSTRAMLTRDSNR